MPHRRRAIGVCHASGATFATPAVQMHRRLGRFASPTVCLPRQRGKRAEGARWAWTGRFADKTGGWVGMVGSVRTISVTLAMPVLLLLGLVPAAAAQTTGPPAEAASSTAASRASSATAPSTAAAMAMPRHISFLRWQGAMLAKGATSGTTATEAGVVIHGRTTRTTYRDP